MSHPLTFSVVNWDRHQHYKDRSPPWIKLYREVLTDYDVTCLDPWERWCLVGIWVLAAETDNEIPADHDWLRARLTVGKPPPLEKLQTLGFIEFGESASKALAHDDSKALDFARSREAETERETEKIPIGELWEVWVEEVWGGETERRLTDKRRKKLEMVWDEHLDGMDEPVEFFRKMVGAMLADDWWGPKESTHVPEKALKNAERREEWAVAARNGKPSTGGVQYPRL